MGDIIRSGVPKGSGEVRSLIEGLSKLDHKFMV